MCHCLETSRQIEPNQFGDSHLRNRCIQRRMTHKQNSFKITSRGVQH